jgi:hypothetical protein
MVFSSLSRKRALPLAAILAVLILALCTFRSDASLRPADPIRFLITQDGERLGRHTVSFEKIGGDLHVKIAIDATTELPFLGTYTYAHRNHEVWRDGKLIKLNAETDDNGDRHWVTATATETSLRVDGSGGRYDAPLNTVPTSCWFYGTVRQHQLLDTTNGKLISVRIAPKQTEFVETVGGVRDATRYDVSGDLNLTLWYSETGRWLKSAFRIAGSDIEYLLDESRNETY